MLSIPRPSRSSYQNEAPAVPRDCPLSWHRDRRDRPERFARRPVRLALGTLVFPVAVALFAEPAFAQGRPKLLDIDGFMAKGVFTELDPELQKHHFSLREIEESHLDGHATDVLDVLGFLARLEKLRPRVAEPLEVRGTIPVSLPPNTSGGEAYTTCFYALSFNGLVLAGSGDELVLIRPETRPELTRPKRPWNRDHVLSTQLFRLGYLKPDPVMKHYHDSIGTAAGRAVLERRSNILLVSDQAEAIIRLRDHVDSEIMQAMGLPAGDAPAPAEGVRPPSLGAIASREHIHFYLMTFARRSQIPLAAAEEKSVLARRYPEVNLWTSERGYRVLQQEFKRVHEFVQLARQAGGQGWDEPDPQRTLSSAEQKRLSIRFGVVAPLAKGPVAKGKRTARKRP
jgi:hypothetical protein